MTSSILKYVTENELIWKDLVIRSEIETIKLLNKNAQIEFENQNPKFSECISKFLEFIFLEIRLIALFIPEFIFIFCNIIY